MPDPATDLRGLLRIHSASVAAAVKKTSISPQAVDLNSLVWVPESPGFLRGNRHCFYLLTKKEMKAGKFGTSANHELIPLHDGRFIVVVGI